MALPIRRLLPLLIVLVCVIVGSVLGAVALPRLLARVESAPEPASAKPTPGPEDAGVALEPIDLIVNLAGERGRRYLKVNTVLKARDEKAKKQLVERTVEVRDLLNSLMSDLRLEELDGAGKRDKLRRRIKLSINEGLGLPDAVLHVYFDQFIIE